MVIYKDPSVLEMVLIHLEKAAANGERCPTDVELRQRTGRVCERCIAELAKQGRITLEVFGVGWRVVTIKHGPNAGCKTAPVPEDKKHWKRTKVVG